MRQGLGLLALAVVLVIASLWMGGSSDPSIEGNAGPTGLAAMASAVVGAVIVARALMDRRP